MTVEWKFLPSKANMEMAKAGAAAARKFLEETGCNSPYVIYGAMVAAAPQHQGELVTWTSIKPASVGAYWVRGCGLEREALIEVIKDGDELRCNLHQRTTESDFGYGYAIDDLSNEFEWLGPLHRGKP